MSSGSTFHIIQRRYKSNKIAPVTFEKLTQNYFEDTLDTHKGPPPFVHMKDQVVERDTKEIWRAVSEDSFISSFTVLKDYWYMNAYDSRSCTHEVDYEEAFNLKQAASYILSGKRKDWVEELMENPFVEVFREEGYFGDIKAEGGYMQHDLERLRGVTSTFLHLCDSDVCDSYNKYASQFKLLYTAW